MFTPDAKHYDPRSLLLPRISRYFCDDGECLHTSGCVKQWVSMSSLCEFLKFVKIHVIRIIRGEFVSIRFAVALYVIYLLKSLNLCLEWTQHYCYTKCSLFYLSVELVYSRTFPEKIWWHKFLRNIEQRVCILQLRKSKQNRFSPFVF